jgi:hypothetical protein
MEEYALFLISGTNGYIDSMITHEVSDIVPKLRGGETPDPVVYMLLGHNLNSLRKQALSYWDNHAGEKYENSLSPKKILEGIGRFSYQFS